MRQFIIHNAHKIAVYQVGKGPPVVLLHGWPTNAQLWQHQVHALQAQFKVITLDWLGFGHSDKPFDYDYTFTQQKEVLQTVLQEVLAPEEKVTLIAHDIGGPPAILWAQEHADRVQQLVLLNTVVYPFSTPLDKISHTLFKIPLLKEVLGSRFGLGQIMQYVTKTRSKIISARIQAILSEHQDLYPSLAAQLILAPLEQGKQDELLSLASIYQALTIPRHLIVATEDPLCGAHMARLQDENPSVGVSYLTGCGHYLAVEEAEGLTGLLWRVLLPDRVAEDVDFFEEF